MNRTVCWSLLALFALDGSRTVCAQAPLAANAITGPQIIPLGSPLIFGGTNAPDTYSATTTFGPTKVVDNGNVTIWQEQVPTGSNSEWDVWYVKTNNGGPLAGNINAYWDIVMNYTLSAPAFFDQVVQQWMVNGTPVSPITNGIGTICCAATSNPILPGAGYYNSGFSVALSAGVQTNWKQIFVTPYSLIQAGGINPSTANEFVFALHFTLQAAMPIVTGAISASQFGAFPTFGPGSWIEIYGTNLASDTEEWGGGNFNGVNAPTKLGGTSATIGGQAAFVQYISSVQVNVQVPGGVATGSQPLVVTTEAGSSAPFMVTVDAVQPGLYSPSFFNVGGTQYVGALFPDGVTYAFPPGAVPGFTSKRAKPGDTITLYGIGFGSVNPSTPPGQIAEGTSMLAAPFTVSIGGTQATVSYDGLAPTFVGLYQFNVVVPAIAASDSARLIFSLNGANGTQKLSIAVGN